MLTKKSTRAVLDELDDTEPSAESENLTPGSKPAKKRRTPEKPSKPDSAKKKQRSAGSSSSSSSSPSSSASTSLLTDEKVKKSTKKNDDKQSEACSDDDEDDETTASLPGIAGSCLKPEWWDVLEAVLADHARPGLSSSPSSSQSSSPSSSQSSSPLSSHGPLTSASDAVTAAGPLVGRFSVDRDSYLAEWTTHLVIGEHKRTFKVLQALARGLWIVGYDWVLQSIGRERWLAEEKFEAVFWFPGCRVSRQRLEDNAPPLMAGKRIFVNGQNTSPPPDDLRQLIVESGGELAPNFRSCNLCLSSSAATRPRKNPNNVPILRCDWFLDSLQDYCLKDYAPYQYNAVAAPVFDSELIVRESSS